MTRLISCAALVVMCAAGGVSGQEDDRFCPPPRYTLETLKEHLLDMAARQETGLVARALAPGPSCPALAEDQDLQAAMVDLIRFMVAQNDGFLTRNILSGVRLALKKAERRETAPTIRMGTFFPDRRWTFTPGPLSAPVDALILAVEQGRSGHTRSSALWTMTELLPNAEVHAYLLRWARALRGPPTFPQLPEEIAQKIYISPNDEDQAEFRRALESDLELVQNPMARCWVESRGPPSDVPTREPRCGGGR